MSKRGDQSPREVADKLKANLANFDEAIAAAREGNVSAIVHLRRQAMRYLCSSELTVPELIEIVSVGRRSAEAALQDLLADLASPSGSSVVTTFTDDEIVDQNLYKEYAVLPEHLTDGMKLYYRYGTSKRLENGQPMIELEAEFKYGTLRLGGGNRPWLQIRGDARDDTYSTRGLAAEPGIYSMTSIDPEDIVTAEMYFIQLLKTDIISKL